MIPIFTGPLSGAPQVTQPIAAEERRVLRAQNDAGVLRIELPNALTNLDVVPHSPEGAAMVQFVLELREDEAATHIAAVVSEVADDSDLISSSERAAISRLYDSLVDIEPDADGPDPEPLI